MRKYKLLGIEELNWTCEFCGKKEIGTCYTVEDQETGEIKRFGSVCIKKALKITTKELNEEIKKEIKNIKEKYADRIFEAFKKCNYEMKKYREENDYHIGFLPKEATDYWKAEEEYQELLNKKAKEIQRFKK